MYCYQCYGLILGSEMELPFLIPSKSQSPDVIIRLDQELSLDFDYVENVKGFLIGINRNVFFESKFGWMLIKDGNQISIKLREHRRITEAVQYAMGSGLGVVFHQRQTLALHASAVKINDVAVLFCGVSGSGKSTTAMSFVNDGRSLISDDISVIHFQDNQAYVHSGYPRQKIAADILAATGDNIGKNEKPFDENRNKYYRSPAGFSQGMIPIHCIYHIRQRDVEHPTLQKTDGTKSFARIYRNSFRFGLIKPLGFSEKHLELCGKLCNSVEIRAALFPENGIAIASSFEMIKNDINAIK
jgi:hypothetical protein